MCVVELDGGSAQLIMTEETETPALKLFLTIVCAVMSKRGK